ncbi:MAG: secondary thiamine-phosphate synthase enzyme YjbQ, partial [Candidatus Edwardsbacteria bacterium]|nr:secondary thiamine-phosphate synthase enzyme YjbQ [Candidatus Edwardsbacteria bacterium]
MLSFSISTSSRAELVDITGQVQRIVRDAGITDGLCHVWVPHTTAGLTVNENADPDVARDLLAGLD